MILPEGYDKMKEWNVSQVDTPYQPWNYPHRVHPSLNTEQLGLVPHGQVPLDIEQIPEDVLNPPGSKYAGKVKNKV